MATSRTAKKKTNDIMSKKIPENPKYKHISATVDTGSSVTKYMDKIEDIRKNYRLRKDEIYKRMKASTFAQLVLQVAEVVNLELEREKLSTGLTVDNDPDGNLNEIPQLDMESLNGHSPPNSSRSTLHEVISGIGEVELKDSGANRKQIHRDDDSKLVVPETSSLPFLLLDVRQKDAFDQCHIIGAQSYPASLLSRSVNYFTKDILEFKNKLGKIIVLYDEDERIAPNATTIFVQRDVDNVFMLSGGMKVISKKFPGCFTSGVLPKTCIPTPPPSRKSKQKTSEGIQQSEQKHLEWFTYDHISRIQDCVDDEMLREDSSRMSSRVSGRSTAASTARSTATQNSSRTTSRHWK